jgi:hypothetical protein
MRQRGHMMRIIMLTGATREDEVAPTPGSGRNGTASGPRKFLCTSAFISAVLSSHPAASLEHPTIGAQLRPPGLIQIQGRIMQRPDLEQLFWQSIVGGNQTAENYENYLKRYPKGEFAGQARERLSQLSGSPRPTVMMPPPPKPKAASPRPVVQRALSGGSEPAIDSSHPYQQIENVLLALNPTYDLNAIHSYENIGSPKALAFQQQGWRPYIWGRNGVADENEAGMWALEGCQQAFGSPCVLVALNSRLMARDLKAATPQDQARLHYSGPYRADQVPWHNLDSLSKEMKTYSGLVEPKAIAVSSMGNRWKVVSGGVSLHEAERAALAGCNDSGSTFEKNYSCYLYASGNNVVLPSNITQVVAPPPNLSRYAEIRNTLIRMSPTFNLTVEQIYEKRISPKAMAIEPQSRRLFEFASSLATDGNETAAWAMEACQQAYGASCVLVAVNEEAKVSDVDRAKPQDMPRVHYSGPYNPDRVPWHSRASLPMEMPNYQTLPEPKAIALNPIGNAFKVITGAASLADAERLALAGCDSRGKTTYPCYLYASGNLVVLPRGQTAPK